MRRLAGALALLALAAPASADDALPPALDKVLWCSSAFNWLASDAFDNADNAQADQLQAWSDLLNAEAMQQLAALGKTEDESLAIVDRYDETSFDNMNSPAPAYDAATDCTALIPVQ